MYARYKKDDLQYKIQCEFRATHKFYCEKCNSYHYLRDKVPYIICRYCGHPVFNTNNPDGKKAKFIYKLKQKMKF